MCLIEGLFDKPKMMESTIFIKTNKTYNCPIYIFETNLKYYPKILILILISIISSLFCDTILSELAINSKKRWLHFFTLIIIDWNDESFTFFSDIPLFLFLPRGKKFFCLFRSPSFVFDESHLFFFCSPSSKFEQQQSSGKPQRQTEQRIGKY